MSWQRHSNNRKAGGNCVPPALEEDQKEKFEVSLFLYRAVIQGDSLYCPDADEASSL